MRPSNLFILIFSLFLLVTCDLTKAQGEDVVEDDYNDFGFEVPEPIIEVFKPRGFRVSIPNIKGIRLFAFHANINEELSSREPGSISKEIKRQRDNYWTYFDATLRLKDGDEINYWIYVDYNDGTNTYGYTKEDGHFRVTNRFIRPIAQANQPITTPKPTPATQRPTKTTTTITTTTTPRPTPTKKQGVGRPPPTPTAQKCQVKGVTRVNGKGTCAGQILFEDNFDKSVLDKTKWKYDVKLGSAPDYEFTLYVNHPDNVAIKNNNLQIKPTLSTQRYGEDFINAQINLGRNCTGLAGSLQCSKQAIAAQILPPILSGRVTTKDSFSFLYGKVDIRAKVPKGKWIYPIFFLQPKELAYGENYNSGQMRVAFVPGNEDLGKELSGGAILSSTEEGRTAWVKYTQGDDHWGDAYHTYTLKWTPGRISLSVDGKEYGIIEPPEPGGFASIAQDVGSTVGDRWGEGSPMAPFDKDMYLTVGVGVGGHCFTDGVGSKPWKNRDPKNMFNFWKNKDSWFNTWNDNSALKIDYIKITAY